MAIIKSYLLDNVESSLKCDLNLKKTNNLPMEAKLRYMVFKTFIDDKPVFCCLSGGKMINGEPHLTPVGEAALHALCNITSASKDLIIFQEVTIGKTPLKMKIKKHLKKVPRNSVICFFGDMTNELDGVLYNVLNVKGTLTI